MKTKDKRNNKSEHNNMWEDGERLKVLDTCEVLVCLVLAFGIDHINNVIVNELRVLFCYLFVSEKLKVIPKELELVKAVTIF